MPRRNRRRRRKPAPILDPPADLPATYDDMARDLVKRGLASVLILGTPSRHHLKEHHQ